MSFILGVISILVMGYCHHFGIIGFHLLGPSLIL